MAHGAEALADRELLAVLLGTGGAPGVGAHALAERLLARFGSLAALSRAHHAELATVPGVGEAKASALAAAAEIARRGEGGAAPPKVASSADVATIASPLLRGRTRERLVLVVCDQAHRVISCDTVSEGAVDRSPVPLREIVVAALRRDGRAFALAHNHPGGDPTPSGSDVDATRRVTGAASSVGLRFLDHVVVTDTSWRRVTTPH